MDYCLVRATGMLQGWTDLSLMSRLTRKTLKISSCTSWRDCWKSIRQTRRTAAVSKALCRILLFFFRNNTTHICRSETCCSRIVANTGRKKVAKNRHLGTIAQLRRAISSQLRHVSAIWKELVKQQYLLHMSLQYSELRPTSSWDRFIGLWHPT